MGLGAALAVGGSASGGRVNEVDIARIERGVRAAVAQVIRGCEALDLEMAFGPYLKTEAFRMVSREGVLCDYRRFFRDNEDYLKRCSEFRLATLAEYLGVLGPHAAVFLWVYRAEAVFESGVSEVFDPAAATFVFREMDGEWRIVSYHESGVPPRLPTGTRG